MASEKGIGRHFFAAGTLYHANADSALTASNNDTLFIVFKDGTGLAADTFGLLQ